MDYFNYLNADYEIYQSIPERINDDVEFTELQEISPQKIYDLEPFLSNNYSYSLNNYNYDLNNYPKYNNYILKVFLFIFLIIIFIIFIFTHFF